MGRTARLTLFMASVLGMAFVLGLASVLGSSGSGGGSNLFLVLALSILALIISMVWSISSLEGCIALTWRLDNLSRVMDGCQCGVSERVGTRLVLQMYIYRGGLKAPTMLVFS